MYYRLKTFVLGCAATLAAFPAFAQLQTCPSNINFSEGSLALWSAATGLVLGGSQNYPAPNTGVTTIPEYTISTTGIQVITTSSNDPFGGFPTIPTINGYAYGYSVKLGSTATSWDLHAGRNSPGGFTRSITYKIDVPAGSSTVPYTMTYAYAMVLENGTHNSDQQPLFKATLSTPDGVITCASPEYYLPTFNDAGSNGGGFGTGATLDTATARANGFSQSPVPFLSHSGRQNQDPNDPNNDNGTLLYDVWTKGWREVTFDLSPYRGKQVTLTFEADNCVPGAHFAYAYVALRNSCAGLEISGPQTACTNNKVMYSVPALANATYSWSIPDGWAINSGAGTNILTVTPGTTGGSIAVHEVNSCADLRANITVATTPPTVAGRLTGDNLVCAGTNSSSITLSGENGTVQQWVSSTDGINWTPISYTGKSYTAQDLNATTQYAALVQNGSTCSIDTSSIAVVTVDQQSDGGMLDPATMNICTGQNQDNLLTLTANTGAVLNWQLSDDNTNWSSFSPTKTDSAYQTGAISTTTYYRVIVKNGVCAADTSAVSAIAFFSTPFPSAVIDPATSSICYGDAVRLNATISIGTNYIWSPVNTLIGGQPGAIADLPYTVAATATPSGTTDYVLTVRNNGCPNALRDTFHVAVTDPIIVFAGNDTAIVAGQPLQLNATVNDPDANLFSWTPATGLNFTNIPNPVTILRADGSDTLIYIVKATDAIGCYGTDSIKVSVFKTGADIFVPSAFTPNGDGVNDMARPICVGIKQLVFFRVYDRWGRLVFNTTRIGQGWDGRIRGTDQPMGGFVYVAQGIDYTGKTVFRKGSILLIR